MIDSHGRRACPSSLSMTASASMGGDAAAAELEEDTDIFASFRPLTEGPVFIAIQVTNTTVCRLVLVVA